MADDTSLRFEDLSIDDTLPPLRRLLQYSQSPIALQRLVYVKQLSEVCISTSLHELQSSVLPVIRKLEEDEEYVVRQHLIEQVVSVGIGVMVREGMESDSIPQLKGKVSSPVTMTCIQNLLCGPSIPLYKTEPYRPLILETFLPMRSRMLSDQSHEVGP